MKRKFSVGKEFFKGAAATAAAILFSLAAAARVMGQSGDAPYMKERFVFLENSTHPSCHGSTIAVLPNGDALAAWYAGAAEKANDVAVWSSRLKKGEAEWTPPEVLHDNPGHSEGNPVLFAAPDGSVWFFYVTIYGKSWNDCKIHAKVSRDDGHTWGPERTLREKFGWMTRNKPLVLSDGDWLLPLYDETLFKSHFYKSSDRGETWKNMGQILPLQNLQPTVIERKDGTLYAMMRNAVNRNKHIWEAISRDKGKTWSKARFSAIPNPGSAVDMVQLPNKHVVLAFNPSFSARDPLAVALSEDEGRTWPWMRILEGPGGDYHYPAIAAGPDGLLHVTYTWKRERIKHIEFNEAWVRAGETDWLNKIPPEK